MENKKKKIKITKTHIFQGTLGLSFLLVAFGAFNINEINQTQASINLLETRIQREQIAIREANQEIEEITAEYEGVEESFPLDIDGRVPLIVRDIKRLISSYDIGATIEPSGSGRSRVAVATLDNESGLRTISFNVSLSYNRYNDVKEMIEVLRDTFPITIDSVVFSSRDASFTFTMYGN